MLMVEMKRMMKVANDELDDPLQNKGKYEGGHARGKSRCDQFSAVISLVL